MRRTIMLWEVFRLIEPIGSSPEPNNDTVAAMALLRTLEPVASSSEPRTIPPARPLPIVSPQRQAQRFRTATRRKLRRSGKRRAWRERRENSAIVAGRTGLAVDSIRAATGPSAVMAPAMALARGRDYSRLVREGPADPTLLAIPPSLAPPSAASRTCVRLSLRVPSLPPLRSCMSCARSVWLSSTAGMPPVVVCGSAANKSTCCGAQRRASFV
jgi:hypothetical protein